MILHHLGRQIIANFGNWETSEELISTIGSFLELINDFQFRDEDDTSMQPLPEASMSVAESLPVWRLSSKEAHQLRESDGSD